MLCNYTWKLLANSKQRVPFTCRTCESPHSCIPSWLRRSNRRRCELCSGPVCQREVLWLSRRCCRTDDRSAPIWNCNGMIKINKELETKASSHEGQCIPAGCRVSPPKRVLITVSIMTMRSISLKFCVRLFTLCKISTEIFESCGAT